MAEETVYLGDYDNTSDFRLESPVGSGYPLVNATQINADIDGILVSSTNQQTDLIRWNQPGYETGEVRCKFGAVPGLFVGRANCHFIVYDLVQTNGVVFEPVVLTIRRVS